MKWARPDVLWLLALGLPALALVVAHGLRRRRRALARLGELELVARSVIGVHAERRRIRAGLALVGVACALLAAARPQWGVRSTRVVERGVDVVLAVDTSASMLAEDVPPNRLERARGAAHTLIERLPGVRFAVVAFAGAALVHCPLTVDHEALGMFLDALDAETVPVAGSGLAEAIRVGAGALPDEETLRAVVVLSDGESHFGDAVAAATRAAARGVQLHAVGFGTATGGPIPVRDAGGRVLRYRRDRSGRVVATRLHEAALQAAARAGGGRYFRGTLAEDELGALAAAIAALPQREREARRLRSLEDRYQWPLALGVACLLAALALPETPRRRVTGASAAAEDAR